MRRRSLVGTGAFLLPCLVACLWSRTASTTRHTLVPSTLAFAPVSFTPTTRVTPRAPPTTVVWEAAPEDSDATTDTATTTTTTTTTTTLNNNNNNNDLDYIDPDAPAGIVGAQFFGGNKEKEIFFDPVAEAQASTRDNSGDEDEDDTDAMVYYDRFANGQAFGDDAVTAALARDVQAQLTAAVVEDDSNRLNSDTNDKDSYDYTYAPTVDWTTPLASTSSTTPISELIKARAFYRRIHVAVVCGRPVSSSSSKATHELRWEISVVWPALWEPRVLLTGTSVLTLDQKTIVQQIDTLDTDLIPTIQRQIGPRFWDVYHIGMTPPAEVFPQLPPTTPPPGRSSWFPTTTIGYTVTEDPPRLVSRPSRRDTGTREDQTALILPNHAFSCVIKTMGPTKQRYTPVTGVQVQLLPPLKHSRNKSDKEEKEDGLRLQWDIPLATEYAAQPRLRVPSIRSNSDNDDDPRDPIDARCEYVLRDRRRVATVRYGGGPQDADIAAVRKTLYDRVVRDGWTPKLREGRPIFFFAPTSVKACYTEEGLGMAVYEWRPEFTKPNEVGIVLEMEDDSVSIRKT